MNDSYSLTGGIAVTKSSINLLVTWLWMLTVDRDVINYL